jgi:hypothetical protein
MGAASRSKTAPKLRAVGVASLSCLIGFDFVVARDIGKAKMTIVPAAMRKLLTLAYGVLKSGRALDLLVTWLRHPVTGRPRRDPQIASSMAWPSAPAGQARTLDNQHRIWGFIRSRFSPETAEEIRIGPKRWPPVCS